MTLRKSRLRLTQAIFFGEPAQAGGTGTVTSVLGGNGIVATPSPIVGVGNVDLGPLTADWTASVVAPGSTPKAITAKGTTQWFNVVSYGADPTGVNVAATTTAIQKAVNDAIATATVGSATVYFPPGSYLLNAPIAINTANGLTLRGDGQRASIIRNANNLDIFTITGAGNNENSFNFYDLMFLGDGASTVGASIHHNTTSASPLFIQNCQFFSHFVGIQMNSSFLSTIIGCVFNTATANAIDIWVNNTSATPNFGDNKIIGNTFISAAPAKYSIRSTKASGISISQNKFLSSAQYSLFVDNSTADELFLITGNSFEGAVTLGNAVFANTAPIISVNIESNEFGIVPGAVGISFAPTTGTGTIKYVTIGGNEFGAIGGGSFGLYFGPAAAAGCAFFNIFGNQFVQPGYCVYFAPAVAGGCDSFGIAGNQFVQPTIAAIQLPGTPANATNIAVGQNQYIAGGGVYVAGTFDTTSGFGFPGIFTKAGFNTQSPTREVDIVGTIRSRGIAAPAVSEANSGTIYFDSGLNKYRVSLDGSAYVDLVGSGGVTGSGVATKVAFWDAPTNLTTDSRITIGLLSTALDLAGDLNLAIGDVIKINNVQVFSNDTAGHTLAVGSGINAALPGNSTAVGVNALAADNVGASNTAVGFDAGTAIVAGIQNTAIGTGALGVTTTGNGNVALGQGSGITNTTGSQNVFVGQSADASAGNLTNAVAIGYQAQVASNDSMVLGNGMMNVGIRTSTPKLVLDVNGAIGTRHHDVALVNGLNSDVVPTLTSWIRVTGPSAPFSIGGFTSGVDGRIMYIRNTVAFQMTINHLDGGSGATNQIVTPTAAPINCSVATLIYEDSSDLWYVMSYF